jgi:hypothetical protein
MNQSHQKFMRHRFFSIAYQISVLFGNVNEMNHRSVGRSLKLSRDFSLIAGEPRNESLARAATGIEKFQGDFVIKTNALGHRNVVAVDSFPLDGVGSSVVVVDDHRDVVASGGEVAGYIATVNAVTRLKIRIYKGKGNLVNPEEISKAID